MTLIIVIAKVNNLPVSLSVYQSNYGTRKAMSLAKKCKEIREVRKEGQSVVRQFASIFFFTEKKLKKLSDNEKTSAMLKKRQKYIKYLFTLFITNNIQHSTATAIEPVFKLVG